MNLPFLSLRTVNTVTHSYDTSDLTPQFYWLRTDRILDVVFQVSTIFRLFFFCQISYSNFWVDIRFQASARNIFSIRLRPISHKFPTSFFLNSPNTRIYIYSCAVVQTLSRDGDKKFLWFGSNVSQHQTGWLLLCIIKSVRASSHMKTIPGFFLCSPHSSDHCAIITA